MNGQIIFFLGCLNLASVAADAAGGVPRIIGGDPTSIEKHPWQVSIQVFQNHVCGGSIISPDTILTAAHCITEEDELAYIEWAIKKICWFFLDIWNLIFSMDEALIDSCQTSNEYNTWFSRLLITSYYVVPGTTDLREAKQKVQVKEAIIHNCYDSDTVDYDIAILKLEENLTFSEKIQSINLPNENFTVAAETNLIASGWGTTEDVDNPEPVDILREVEVKLVNWDTCKSKLSSVGSLTERMICAGVPEGGKDTCQLDSGGALELNGTLIGIVSWGEGCGEPGYPGVYTHVSYLRPWIAEHTGL